MLAASTASAPPTRMPSARWSSVPTPPEAMTGTVHGIADGAGELQVEPGLGAVAVHAGEQDLAGSAPGHLGGPLHGVQPVFLRPPWLYTSQPGPRAVARRLRVLRRLASIATTMHWAPYLSEASSITCGLAIAAELKLVLSAPALSSRRTSSTVRTPPPTVSGMNTWRGHGLDDVQDQVAVVAGGGDVQEREFVGTLLVVAGGDLDRDRRRRAARRN
jgi:hypothetical protein